MDKWTSFYEPYFRTRADAAAFVGKCENLDGPHPAKLIMHQTQRLVSLANDIVTVRNQDSLRVLFLVICAENVSKLQFDFQGEGDSKKHVLRFFNEFASAEDKATINGNCMSLTDDDVFHPESLDEILTGFYSVRCDVVHEGTYWGFMFSDDGIYTTGGQSPFATRMRADEFRNIVVRTCINAAQTRIPRPSK